MFRMRSVSAVVVVAASVLLLVLAVWAEEKGGPNDTEFEVVIPKVTIDVTDAPADGVVAEIAKQCRAQFGARLGSRHKVTLHLKEVPVLHALKSVADATHALYFPDPRRSLQLVPSAKSRGWLYVGPPLPREPQASALAGPCLLVAGPIQVQVPAALDRPPDNRIEIFCFVVSDPPPQRLEGPFLTELRAQEGRDLLPLQDTGSVFPSPSEFEVFGGIAGTNFHLEVDGLQRDTRSLTVKGTVQLIFPLETEEVTFDLADDAGRVVSVGDLSIEYRGPARRTVDEEGVAHIQGGTFGEVDAGGGAETYSFRVKGARGDICRRHFNDAEGRAVGFVPWSSDMSADGTTLWAKPPRPAAAATFEVVTRSSRPEYPFELEGVGVRWVFSIPNAVRRTSGVVMELDWAEWKTEAGTSEFPRLSVSGRHPRWKGGTGGASKVIDGRKYLGMIGFEDEEHLPETALFEYYYRRSGESGTGIDLYVNSKVHLQIKIEHFDNGVLRNVDTGEVLTPPFILDPGEYHLEATAPPERVEELRAIDRELFGAVDASDIEAVSACLAKGANVNARVGTITPLHEAARYGKFAVAEVLIAKGADVNAPDHLGWGTALQRAVLSDDKKMVELLVRSGADLALRNGGGVTALRSAVDLGYADMVDVLLQSGAVPDIFTASALGQVGRVRELLEDDPDLARAHDTLAMREPTALHKASHYGHMEVVQLLLAYGADVNAKDARNATPMHEAVYSGQTEIAELLIEHGADVNPAVEGSIHDHGRVRHEWHDTPLHLAARKGDVAMVEVLLANGADVTAKNRDGRWLFGMVPPPPRSGPTPLGVALKEGHNEVADVLRRHGAKE